MSSEVSKPLFWIVAILALCVWSISSNDVILGLDLRGGVTLRYELELPEGQGPAPTTGPGGQVDSMIETTVETLRKRIDTYGIRESSITRQGERELIIELPGQGQEEAESIKSAIARVGRLEWRIVASDDLRNELSIADEQANLETFLGENAGAGPNDINLSSLERQFSDVLYRWIPFSDKNIARNRGIDELTDETFETQPLTAADFVLFKIGAGRSRNFTGADIESAQQTLDDRQAPAVGIDMKPSRSAQFGDWTEEHKGQALAIVLDGRVAEPPATIQSRLDRAFYIKSGSAVGFRSEEITEYLTIIRSGSLQLKPRLLFQNSVGPSLGESSIETGTKAGLYGALVVVLFTLLYYRFNGLIAVLCLLVNMTMLGGLLLALGATITLPGMAGLVLTIGMAIDANILVFERLREESDKAKSIGQAVKLGFQKATSTILDANITTFVTAFILYKLGTGPVRGFSVVLMLGILTSVFSVLVFGRTLYMLLSEKDMLPSVAMGRLVKKGTNIGFMAKARLFTKLSVVAVIVSLAGFTMSGSDTYGLDFLGGYKAQVRLGQSASQAQINDAVGPVFPGAQVVTVLNDGATAESSNQFVIKIKGDPGDEEAAAAQNDSDTLQDQFEVPLKAALGAYLLPDFVTGLSLVPDEPTASTGLTATLNFEGSVVPDAVASELGFMSGLQVKAGGERSVNIAGTLPGTGLDPKRVVQRLNVALDGAVEAGSIPSPSQPFLESTTIGSRVGTELRDSAIRAIILSFIAIVIYIRVRFKEYRYGIAAIVALAHDVSITLGLVALVHHFGAVDIEIDLPMIAAFLTIVGYSLNDTIVLFDRVRENLPRIDRPIEEVLDISINQTLSRTLLTSITTLLVLIVIFYFSKIGEQHVLEGFSFAMIVGVLVGTYSSIFVASPVVAMLARRSGERHPNAATPRVGATA